MNIPNYKDLRYNIQSPLSDSQNNSIIGGGESMNYLFQIINKLAHFPTPVLILGESGTGKELVAKALHYNGNRGTNKFVPVNCAGIPEGLLESELFGHVRGSFTGAVSDRKGLTEEANQGTLFLDEIGEMGMGLQAKILRMMQDGEIRRVGANNSIYVDVRIVAATNNDLEKRMKEGKFREDLFQRLNSYPLYLPNLKERTEDIIPLTYHLIAKYQKKFRANGTNTNITGISESALQKLKNFQDWRGNIRTLENLVQRAIINKVNGPIEEEDVLSDDEMKKEKRKIIPYNDLSSRVLSSVVSAGDSSTRPPEGNFWFSEGVLPITSPDLGRIKGIIPQRAINCKAEKREIHSINLKSHCSQYVSYAIFLTPSTLKKVISFNSDNNQIEILLEKIKKNTFIKLINTPFIVAGTSFLKNRYQISDTIRLINKLRQTTPYRISEKPFCCVITEDMVEQIVPFSHSDNGLEKVENIKLSIREEHAKFLRNGYL